MPITRRQFLGELAAAAQARPQPAKWNLVLITNDQLRADCLGCYGNPVIRTPAMDKLASQGAMFLNDFVQTPQCVPSRASLHTGRYPHVTRTPTNSYVLPESEQTLARVLGSLACKTAVAGELPFAPRSYLGGFAQAFPARSGWNREKLSPEQARRMEKYQQLSKQQFQAAPAPWPEELDETATTAREACRFLRENRGGTFFLHVSFRRPHHPFDPPAPFDKMYLGANFPKSHKRDGEMENKPPSQQQALRNSVGFDLMKMTPADLERVKAYYYGMISENDKYIGTIMEELKGLGLEGNTVVVCTADHGEMLGDHGLLFKGGYMYDEVLHVPLIIRAPGRLPAGARVRSLVEEIDVFPTVMDLLGMESPPGVQGKSLAPLGANPGKSHKEAVFAEFPTIKMVRTEGWKLVHYPKARYGEFYDLKNDPEELYNLYDDPKHLRTRNELTALLADWLINSQDPKLAPIKAGDAV